MPAPYDYAGQMGLTPTMTLDAMNKAVLGNQAQLQNQALQQEMDQKRVAFEQAQQRVQQKQTAWKTLVASPTPENVFAYNTLFPEDTDALKNAWGVLSSQQQQSELKTMADVTGALDAGDPTAAQQILSARRDADKAAGIDTSHYDGLLQVINSNPDAARGMAHLALSAVAPDKFGESYQGLEKGTTEAATRPFTTQTAAATASQEQTKAQFAPQMAQSQLATDEANRQKTASDIAHQINSDRIAQGRLQLDQDTLTTNTQLKLQELAQTGSKPDQNSAKVMDDAAAESVDSQASADKLNDLASKFDAAQPNSGPFATISEWWKRTTGQQNGYTQLRAEYNQIRNSEALKGRKNMPGQMSDADRKFLMEGFPPTNASAHYIAGFVRAMAHAQTVNAKLADRKASWISANGNLGSAKRDITVSGTQIPAGTSFAQFMAQVGVTDTKGQLPAGVAGLMQRYGQ